MASCKAIRKSQTREKRVQGKRGARKAAKKGVVVADARAVETALKAVQGQIHGLANLQNHNGKVVQGGFYGLDVWNATFRLVLSDISATLDELCSDTVVTSKVRKTEDGEVDFQNYWEQSGAELRTQIEEAQRAKLEAEREKAEGKEEPAPPAEDGKIVEPTDDVIVFGGDDSAENT